MRIKFVYLLLILAFSNLAKAQNSDKQVANELVRNMLLYQMLNDFTTVIPVFFIVPGWYFFGSFEVSQMPVFVDEDYYAELDLKNRKSALHKELFEVFDVNFIPEITEDKHMEVRLIDDERLLYRLRVYRNDDTLFLLQASGKNFDEKLFKIVGGELMEVIKKDKYGVSVQHLEKYGDTLIINRDFDAKKNIYYFSELRYSNQNQLQSKSTFKQKANGKSKLISKQVYHYINNTLASIKNFNKNGTLIDSTVFTYNLDNLISSINKMEQNKNIFSINFKYNDDGALIKKGFLSNKIIYDIEYNRERDNIVGLKMNFLRNDQNEFLFDINLQNQLSRIQHLKSYYRALSPIEKDEILFNYNANGNIKSIRVIDKKGKISKEINFEYAYFTL
jgi:hypothetical protein